MICVGYQYNRSHDGLLLLPNSENRDKLLRPDHQHPGEVHANVRLKSDLGIISPYFTDEVDGERTPIVDASQYHTLLKEMITLIKSE